MIKRNRRPAQKHITRTLSIILSLVVMAGLCIPLPASADTTVTNSNWTMTYSLTVDGAAVTGSSVTVESGKEVTVSYSLNRNQNYDSLTLYDDTFTIVLPAAIHSIIDAGTNGSFVWPQSTLNTDNGQVFTQADAVGPDESGNYTYTLKFDDFFKGGNSEEDLYTANGQFTFTSAESFTLSYEASGSSDSLTLNYNVTTPTTPTESITVTKALSMTLVDADGDGAVDTKKTSQMYVHEGAYVGYTITVTIRNTAQSNFSLDCGDLFDGFDSIIYSMVDKAEYAANISTLAGGGYAPATSAVSWQWVTDTSSYSGYTDAHDKLSAKLGNPLALKLYTTDGTITVDTIGGSGTIKLYVWLKVNTKGEAVENNPGLLDSEVETYWENANKAWSVASSGYGYDKFQNGAYYNGTAYASGIPGYNVYYDVALSLRATSVYRGSGQDANTAEMKANSTVYNQHTYNNSFDNLPTVQAGDYVTYRVAVTNNQGTMAAKVNEVKVWIPDGLTMITDASDLPAHALGYNASSSTAGSWSTKTPAVPGLIGNSYRFSDVFQDVKIIYSDVDYSGLYNVAEYAFDTSSAGLNLFSSSDGTEYFYFTCRVNDISASLDSFQNGLDETSAARYDSDYASALLYMVTAEITAITDKSGYLVEDADSYIGAASYAVENGVTVAAYDTSPAQNAFNDWFDMTTMSSAATLKSPSLFYYKSSTQREADNDTSRHVRLLNNWRLDTYSLTPKYDEDDFDFELIMPLKPGEVKPERTVEKQLATGFSKYGEVKTAIETWIDGAGKSHSDYIWLSGTSITSTKTIVPYVVYVNPMGTYSMKNVEFTDTLPASMSFLADGNGKPFVMIYEQVESGGVRVRATLNGTDVDVIDQSSANLYLVKNCSSDAYNTPSTATGETLHKPGGVAANSDDWDYGLRGGGALYVNFGDIENNSYVIVYFAVIDSYELTYKNTAAVSSNIGTDYSSHSNIKWDMGTASAGAGKVVKTLSDGEAKSTKAAEVVEVVGIGDNRITYRLRLNFTMANMTFQAGEIAITDVIDDLGLGYGNVGIVAESLKVTDGSGSIVSDPVISFDPGSDVSSPSVVIRNNNSISNTVDFYAYFTVRYKEIPSGITITNTFWGTTTRIETPAKLEVTKVQANGSSRLNATFSLTYDEDGNEPVVDINGGDITLTTASSGVASAEFYPDSAKASAANTWTMWLTETTTPSGYYGFGMKDSSDAPAKIKLTVTKSSDGKYAASADQNDDFYTLSTSSTNVFELRVQNYRIPTGGSSGNPTGAKVTFNAEKTLDGGEPGNALFSFTLSGPSGVIETVTNSSDGAVGFSALTFDEEGTYTYTISEVVGSGAYNYDTTEYTAIVTVTLSGGNYRASVSYRKDGASYSGTLRFANTAISGENLTDISVSKVWDVPVGSDTPNDVRVQLLRDGSVYGGLVTLSSPGWSYTWSNLDRSYSWSVTEVNVPSGYTSSVSGSGNSFTITNSYDNLSTQDKTIPISFVLKAGKEYNGHEPSNATFRFLLTDADGNILQTKTNDASGVVEFDVLSISGKGGPYVYRISEMDGGVPVIVYDSSVYEVVVNAVKSDDGDYTSDFEYYLLGEDGSRVSSGAPMFSNTSLEGSAEEYMEFDEDGIWLGSWQFDEESGEWSFIPEHNTPLSSPETGDSRLVYLLIAAMVSAFGGLVLLNSRRRRPH